MNAHTSAPTSGPLRPVLPKDNTRYDQYTTLPQLGLNGGGLIPVGGLRHAAPPARGSWVAFINPEGKAYFLHVESAQIAVVTEADLNDRTMLERASLWVAHLRGLADSLVADPHSAEAFISISGDESAHSCEYYIVDHAARQVFWLEEVSSDDVGLHGAVSDHHLHVLLEEQYWTHLCYFPMHRPPVTDDVFYTLMTTLSYGIVDAMTSSTSTVFMSGNAPELNTYLSVLERFKSRDLRDGNTTWIVARIWQAIYHQRILIHYGEVLARIDHEQTVHEVAVPSNETLAIILATLTFGFSRRHQRQLDDAFTDEVIFYSRWQALVKSLNAEWASSIHGSLISILLHFPLVAITVPIMPDVTLPASIALSVSGLLSGCVLSQIGSELEEFNSSAAVRSRLRMKSNRMILTICSPLAFVYALPRAFQIWGTLALGVNWVAVAIVHLGQIPALVLVALLCLVMLLSAGLLRVLEAQIEQITDRVGSMWARRVHSGEYQLMV
ncbi:unnamed protein product [Mycena citricolor]|uniref:Uncharacterized protein n=1 Tax=Mycena citricolor TaxID=2018698 RepID=A0AAD2HL96_9AGAR|nr:unnamed protein product [Mycena citricolor]